MQRQIYLRMSSIRVLASNSIQQVAQLSQIDRAAGWVSYGQKWKTVNGREYFTDIIGLSSTNDVIGQQSNRIRREKAK